jgi:hypothetical protein
MLWYHSISIQMPNKFINFIFGRREDKQARKNEATFPSKKNKNSAVQKDSAAKDREVSEIISARFGRALERLGER